MRVIALVFVLGILAPALTLADLPEGLMPLDGRFAPPLRLVDMDGEVTDLRDLGGEWVMVHFWASWCGPCRKELPSIQRMAEQLVPDTLRLVMVNTAETEDEVFAFLSIVAPDLTSLMDRDGQVTETWQPRGLPSSFLVDPQGRLRYIALGGRPWDSDAYLQFLRRLTAPDEKATD